MDCSTLTTIPRAAAAHQLNCPPSQLLILTYSFFLPMVSRTLKFHFQLLNHLLGLFVQLQEICQALTISIEVNLRAFYVWILPSHSMSFQVLFLCKDLCNVAVLLPHTPTFQTTLNFIFPFRFCSNPWKQSDSVTLQSSLYGWHYHFLKHSWLGNSTCIDVTDQFFGQLLLGFWYSGLNYHLLSRFLLRSHELLGLLFF